MALLTGAYPARLGWRGGVVGYKIKPKNGLSPRALTIAEVFKSAGYATGISGKWHLGDERSLLPMNQGFDSCFYIAKSNNQTKKLYRDGELIENPFANRKLSQQFTDEAKRFIERHSSQPFFLYLPYTAPHFPAEAHPDWTGKSALGAYGAVVEELDFRVGQLLSCLKKDGLDKKTIVVFLSDNGPEPGQKKWATAKPYRGLKWSALEGGNRVPCIVRYLGEIPSGQVNEDITSAIDLLPTLALACGIDLDKLTTNTPKIDGVSVWEAWRGNKKERPQRNELLFFHGWGTLQAIRVGKWKLYFDSVKEIEGSDSGPVLFDLSQDPEERTDVSSSNPQLVESMKKRAAKKLADIRANSMSLGGPALSADPNSAGKWLD